MQDEEQTYEDLMKSCQQHFLRRNYKQVLLCGQRLLHYNPCDSDVMYTMASTYMHLNQFAEADAYIKQLKKQDAEYIGAYMVEAYMYKKKKQFVTELKLLQWIIKEIERLQTIEPGVWRASLAEAWSLLGSVTVVLGMPELAETAFLKAASLEENKEQAVCEYSNALFVSNYIENAAAKSMRELHHGFNAFFADSIVYPHYLRQKKVLRIGYISPDFRQHPVAFFSKALLQGFSLGKFQVYAYSLSLEDEVSAVLKKQVIWRNLCDMETKEAAQIIYNDQIDILVDLSGHTKNNALSILACKPAPVQISGIGYFNTTGLSTIKYFLSDIYCDPVDCDVEGGFSEEILHLPHSHFCYTPLIPMPDCPMKAPCAKNGYITFGSFNNFNKVTDALLLLWQRILNAVPGSRIILKSQLFDSEEGRQYTKERLQRLNMEEYRFQLRGFTSAYLQEYADIDIALDTFPYTGGATTCEALYMGVPVITLCGKRHGSRFGYSLLQNAGLPECVAYSSEEYVEKAVILAGDQALLHGLRNQLRGILEKSDLMNEKQYIQEMENLYRNLWEKEIALQAEIRLLPERITKEIEHVWRFVHAGRFQEAEALIQGLIPSVGDDLQRKELWEILIGIYIEQGKSEQAKFFLQKLLQNYPEYPYGLFLAARVYFLMDEWDMAIQTANRALQSENQISAAVLSRIYNILGASYKNIGECVQSVIYYKKEIEFAETRDAGANAYSNYLFNLHYLPTIDEAEMFAEHKKYNTVFKDIVPYVHERKKRHEKIRIGYISPDLRYHVVIFFSYAFFRYYDTENFTVFCYAKCAEDAVSRDIAKKVDVWRNISGSCASEAAQLIYKDEIDILFDLSGHTKNNCLPIMAYKPAPVQLSGIGYFDTSGLDQVDYFLADIYTDPLENDKFFTEKLLRLPQSHFCYVPPDTMPECSAMTPAKREGHITFGSFNNFTKTTDEILSLWKKIMQAVPNSRLILKSQVFGSESGKHHVEKRLERIGFSLEQIELRPETANYLEEYKEIDIAFDTYPYPGGGTTCEALYMGVPVITLVGKRHGARFGYSLMKNVGLEICCAFSADEYLRKAIALAEDIDSLDAIHRSLRQNMIQSPLMQGRQYMQELEKLYFGIWEAFVQGLSVEDVQLKSQAVKEIQGELDTAWKQKKWQQVISLSKKRAAFAEDDALSVFRMAWSYIQLGWFDKAQQLLDAFSAGTVLAEDKNLLFLQGMCYHKQGKYSAAGRHFLAALAGAEQLDVIKENVLRAYDLYREMAEVSLLTGELKQAYMYCQNAWRESISFEEKARIYPFWMETAAFSEKDIFMIQNLYHEAAHLQTKYEHKKKWNHARLRIGYISSSFCHCAMFYFYYQLLSEADPKDFSIYCYHLGTAEDGYTVYCKDAAKNWLAMPDCSPEDIGAQIFSDEIDILVDLSGENGGKAAAVIALQPAPVQVSGWQAPSSDLNEVVFQIEEAVGELPFCYTGRSDIIVPAELAGKRNKKYTIGCFTPYALWDDAVFAEWQELFSIRPDLEIHFFSKSFSDEEMVKKAGLHLQNIGFSAKHIVFKTLPDDVLPVFTELDLVLTGYLAENPVYLCHALYMGVPVIALYDPSDQKQCVRKILAGAGLEELAVKNMQEQKEKVRAILLDEAFLSMLHQNLRNILLQSPLMDGEQYVKTMESFYRSILQQKMME